MARIWHRFAWAASLCATVPAFAADPAAPEGAVSPWRVAGDANYPPFSYLERGVPRGLAVDLAREMARRMGRPLDLQLLEWRAAQEQLLEGKVDALFPMSATEARREVFDFSEPVLQLRYAIFTAPVLSTVSALEDLRGLRVGVTAGGLPRELVQDDPRIRLVIIHDYADGFGRIQRAELDAVIVDRWVGTYELASRGITGVRVADEVVASLPAAAAVRKGDRAHLDAINAAVRDMEGSGAITRLLQAWEPQDVLFLTRAQMQQRVVIAVCSILLILVAMLTVWLRSLRREVTIRRSAETRAALLHQRLALATRSAGLATWDWDVRTNEAVWDEEMSRIYGVDAGSQSQVRDTWSRALHPDDRTRVQGEIDAALRQEKPFESEFRIRRGDGTERFIRATGEVICDDAGRVIRMVGANLDITARKAAEAAIRTSEEKFAKAFRASPVAIAVTDLPDGRIIELNDAGARLIGHPREEAVGRTTTELGLWEDAATRDRLLDAARESGFVRSPHVRLRTKQGGIVITDFSAEQIQLTGRPHLISVLADVTARQRAEDEVRSLLAEAEQARTALLGILEDQKRAEDALRVSEARFRSAMVHSSIGMALVGLDGRWLEVNPALCAIVGHEREAMLALNFQALTHPDDLPGDLVSLERLLRGDIESYVREKRYLHRDGHVIWILLNVALLRDASGAPVRFIAQIQDITERHRAAEALEESAHRLSLALQASGLGLWRRNLRTGVADWDERTCAIFGLPPGRPPPIGEEFLAFVVPEDRERVRAEMRRTEDHIAGRRRLDGTQARTEVRHRICRADGAIRHLETHAVVQADPVGNPAGVIGVVADITDIVQAAEEAERLRDQLLQAQKMETLGTLAAGIAHDFNNLLTGINGFVELSAMSLPKDHEAAEFLGNARGGVMQARNLVRRILQFSRRSSGSERVSVHLDEVVRDTATLIAAVLPASVSLEVDTTVVVPPVLADAGQMQQVLMNLCVNGAHAIGADRGTVRIVVDRRVFSRPGGTAPPAGCKPGVYVRVAVIDSGCGMAAATLEKIFTPFFTTKPSGEGTGLGLAVVKSIVNDHAGVIRVESEPGRGTTFEILLPEAPPVVTERQVAPEPRPTRGGGRRLLVVDDEPAIANVARLALAREGYAVDTRTSPTEAWRMVAAAPDQFDALLVDQQMPEMPGLELIRRVREIAPHLPVVIMSGQFERFHGEEAVALGSVSRLEKPFDIATLAKAIESALRPPGPPG